jgi:hypothetical protein
VEGRGARGGSRGRSGRLISYRKMIRWLKFVAWQSDHRRTRVAPSFLFQLVFLAIIEKESEERVWSMFISDAFTLFTV